MRKELSREEVQRVPVRKVTRTPLYIPVESEIVHLPEELARVAPALRTLAEQQLGGGTRVAQGNELYDAGSLEPPRFSQLARSAYSQHPEQYR